MPVALGSAEAGVERVSEGLISAALREYALLELAAGWREVRPDPMPDALLARGFDQFDASVRALPRRIGRDLAAQHTREEAIASDDPFAVLEALGAGDVELPMERVLDAERYRRFFACSDGPRVDGPALNESAELRELGLAPGTTIAFPAGVHPLKDITPLFDKDVQCVTLAGAGMDRTILVLDRFQPRTRLDRLTFTDCTVQSNCDAIDLRRAGVFRAESVRFLGFDCGAGGCGVFDTGDGAVLELVDCRIVGGYGRNPGDGCLFDARGDPILARFERCTLDLLGLRSHGWDASSVVAFVDCSIENLLEQAVPVEENGLVLRSTSITLRPADAGPVKRRELSELFPAWVLERR